MCSRRAENNCVLVSHWDHYPPSLTAQGSGLDHLVPLVAHLQCPLKPVRTRAFWELICHKLESSLEAEHFSHMTSASPTSLSGEETKNKIRNEGFPTNEK